MEDLIYVLNYLSIPYKIDNHELVVSGYALLYSKEFTSGGLNLSASAKAWFCGGLLNCILFCFRE